MDRFDAIILINRESGFGPYEVTRMGLFCPKTESSERPLASFRLSSRSAHPVPKPLIMVESGEVDFSRALTYPTACPETNVNELLQNKLLNEQPPKVSHGKNASQRVPRCQ